MVFGEDDGRCDGNGGGIRRSGQSAAGSLTGIVRGLPGDDPRQSKRCPLLLPRPDSWSVAGRLIPSAALSATHDRCPLSGMLRQVKARARRGKQNYPAAPGGACEGKQSMVGKLPARAVVADRQMRFF